MPFKQFAPYILGGLAIILVAYAGVNISLAQLDAMKTASYQAGFAAAEAKQVTALNVALAKQQRQLEAEFTRKLTTANNANAAIRAEKHALAQRAANLEKEIDYVTTHYRAGPAAQPELLPACIFTTGFVGLYNNAIGATTAVGGDTMPASSATGDTQRTDSATNTAPTTTTENDKLRPSGVAQADILQHVAGYGARCLAIEAQLNGLIDYLENEQRRDANGT
ncbi:hypothetical protein [Rheinheimera maricola]|uniref:Lysis protein n=1 Tax=Rheinheimera maricola TaxID=2793282 RepID=A0ABS7XAH4_9GAMM|nr:hypothetical protein [Rheinheimera maricola]MBZ9612155.1 hypothetical protein [Rheinheimera maricola]